MDIDIDVKNTFDPTKIFPTSVVASMVQDNRLKNHPCGVYLQSIPIDPITNLSAIPYEEAEILGYFKFDFLHLTLLDSFSNKRQIRKLIQHDPDWALLLDENVVPRLFQVSKHAELLKIIQPTSVQELADVIALLRPAKRHLLASYLVNKEKVRQEQLYAQSNSYYFKRSHAISYALTIVLQLHLIELGIL